MDIDAAVGELRDIRGTDQKVDPTDVRQSERNPLEHADCQIRRRHREDLGLRVEPGTGGTRHDGSDVLNLGETALNEVDPESNREMAQPAKVSGLAQRRVTAGDADAQLRSDVLEYVEGLLTGVLRSPILVGYAETVHGARRTALRIDGGALSRERSRRQSNEAERNEQTSFHWFNSSRKFDCAGAGFEGADLPALQPRRGCRRQYRFCVGRRADNH